MAKSYTRKNYNRHGRHVSTSRTTRYSDGSRVTVTDKTTDYSFWILVWLGISAWVGVTYESGAVFFAMLLSPIVLLVAYEYFWNNYPGFRKTIAIMVKIVEGIFGMIMLVVIGVVFYNAAVAVF